MAAPSDVLGPFPPRGLSDHPESAPYGSARVAQNVDFARGDLRPRGGTRLISNGAQHPVCGIDLVCEFSGHIITVSRVSSGPFVGYREICIRQKGVPGTVVGSYWIPGYVPGSPPVALEFGGALYLFIQRDTEHWVYRVEPSSMDIALAPLDTNPPSGLVPDDGPYYSSWSQVHAKFGVEHKGRLFLACTDPVRLIYTAPFYPNYIAQTNEEAFPFGGEIVALASYADRLLVFQDSGRCMALEFGAAGSSEQTQVFQDTAAKSPQTLQQIGHRLQMLSDDGLLAVDQTGSVVAETTANIDEQMRILRAEFPHVSMVHHVAKHQIWLLFPGVRRIFVFNLKSTTQGWAGDWSTITLPADIVPCCLGLVDTGAGKVPMAGVIYSGTDQGYVISFDHEELLSDWTPAGQVAFPLLWITNPIRSLGHNQRYLFRYLRPTWESRGGHTVIVFWGVEGQELSDDLGTLPALLQYIHVPMRRKLRDGTTFQSATQVGFPGGAETEGAVVGNVVPAGQGYIAYDRGEQWFSTSHSLGGLAWTGRWLQWGLKTDAVDRPFVLKAFEIDTRRLDGRRR